MSYLSAKIIFSCSGHFQQETSNEEGNNGGTEDSDENEDEESEAENTTLSTTTLGYGEITPGTGDTGLAAIRLPKKVTIPPKCSICFPFFTEVRGYPDTIHIVFYILFINLMKK